mmetsp:Transcript_6536/g.18284  ORF Transcript_6536/g.18284 Transcript_6536/m.18284 type:complete len:90 (+) Transcript_6536:89-358(+)
MHLVPGATLTVAEAQVPLSEIKTKKYGTARSVATQYATLRHWCKVRIEQLLAPTSRRSALPHRSSPAGKYTDRPALLQLEASCRNQTLS